MMMKMDVPAAPLVLTKLRVPAARPRTVPRARLTGLLAAEQEAALILVCAPAGYGKTTLLATWAQSLLKQGTAVAWYGLDSGDDDPIPFGAYLAASFLEALGASHELTQITQRLRTSPELDLQRILPDLINALAAGARDCVLILDDYHLVSSPAVHSALAYLLDHKPESLRIAIGSRSDPPLPLARLRARGKLLEIRTASLRFTAEEAALFLNHAMQLDLPAEGVTALEARTEGWITGLQLASLAIRAPLPAHNRSQPEAPGAPENLLGSFSGSHRYLADYLMEEVLTHQTGAVQSFLLATSVLERMSAPLCDALLSGAVSAEGPGSASILRELEKANLFVVALDEQGDWYRYHHLFRDFLRNRLEKLHPEQVVPLRRAASAWLAEHGLLREAAAQAFQTRDWEFAAAFVEQNSFTLILHSDIATIYEWCSAFPEAVLQQRPMLALLQGLALAYNFRRQNRARVETRLQQAGQIIAGLGEDPAAQGLNEMAAVVRTFEAMAPDPARDPRPLLALAGQIAAHYPEGDPGRFTGLLFSGYAYLALHRAQEAADALELARQAGLRGGLFFGVVESTFHLARLAFDQGQFGRSAELCRQGQADIAALLAHPEQELPALGCLDVALGCVFLEQNQLETAEKHLRRGLDAMGWGMNPYYLMTAHLALFRLGQVQGRPTQALKSLAALEAVWPDLAVCTRGLRAAQGLRLNPHDPGARAEAANWCRVYPPGQETFPPAGMGPIGAAEAFYRANLAWAECQITLGHPQPALELIQRQLEPAQSNGLTTRRIELQLLLASALQAEEDPPGSVRALRQALALAEPEGYVRIFDRGPKFNRMLADLRQEGGEQASLERILTALAEGQAEVPADGMESRHPPLRTEEGWVEALSERELEVLGLMADGSTNQAIADLLVITVGTVKSHINHILGKLDARNRTEAVARARRLGLIE